MSGKIKGKQIEDSTISLEKLSGSGNVSINSPSQFQIVGTASDPDDVISKKDLDNAISGLTGSGSITVEDYQTGASYSDINKMIFRGNVVSTPGGTAMGVLADGSTPGSVVVWIPAPTYEDYFNQGDNGIASVSTTSRNISGPDGHYDIGSYGTASAQPTINIAHKGILTYTCNDFALYDNINGSLSLTLSDGSDNALKTVTYNLTATGTSTLDGLTINVTSLDPDKDRFKASVIFTIDLNHTALIPLGGKFTVEMEHDNVGDFSYTNVNKVQTAMYDADTSDGSSNATISGAVSMTEGVPVLKYLSGVAYYDNNSSFTVGVTDMDNLNMNTYPTGNQLTMDFSTNSGIPNASIGGGGSGYTNWTNLYNVMGVDYSKSHSISNGNLVTPGINATNDLNTGNNFLTSTTARIHDWTSNVDSETSPGYKWLILSKTSTSDRNTEDFNNESHRLSVSALLGGTETPFGSTASLDSYELQQIQGSSPNGSSRLVYPKIDFTTWLPSVNSNGTDYSSLQPQSITLQVIDHKDDRTSVSETVTGYRWYVRKFSSPDSGQVQANGIFVFDTTFSESDITDGKVRMFLETNSTGDAPTKWYDLLRIPSAAGSIRSNTGGNNLDSNNRISFDTGGWNGWNAYLLIGIQQGSESESITRIDIEGANWG